MLSNKRYDREGVSFWKTFCILNSAILYVKRYSSSEKARFRIEDALESK